MELRKERDNVVSVLLAPPVLNRIAVEGQILEILELLELLVLDRSKTAVSIRGQLLSRLSWKHH